VLEYLRIRRKMFVVYHEKKAAVYHTLAVW
jgi:hypothetical protein